MLDTKHKTLTCIRADSHEVHAAVRYPKAIILPSTATKDT